MLSYHAPNGAEVEFIKREIVWNPAKKEYEKVEQDMTEEDARFMLEELEKEKRLAR